MQSVSIIIPVYNAGQYLAAAVESAMAQTHKDIEIILVDDGSTDFSGALCDEYAEWDSRVRVLHTKNSGPAAARNAGMQMCGGEWVMFLDADDTLEQNAIGLLVEAAETTGAEMVIGDFAKIKDGAVQTRNDVALPASRLLEMKELTEAARQYLKKPNKHLLFAYSWGRLFKTSVIKQQFLAFNRELRTFEDVAFNFSYIFQAKKEAYFLKQAIYNHTVYSHFASATMAINSRPEQLFGFVEALKAAKSFLLLAEMWGDITRSEIEAEIGHARVTLTIIQLVRMCGQFGDGNKQSIVKFIKQLVNDAETRNALKFYSPDKGESRAIPLFIRLKLVWPTIWLCRHKARKRYLGSLKL